LLFEIQIHHDFEMIQKKKFDFAFNKVTECFRCIPLFSNRPIDCCVVWAGLLHSLLDIRVQRRTDLSTEHSTGLQQASGKPRDPTQSAWPGYPTGLSVKSCSHRCEKDHF